MRRPLFVALALGLLAAACAQPRIATVELGSGVRFVPQVADSVDDAGAFPSVAVTSQGQPFVAYFGFPETLPEGQTANPRAIGLPSVPGVLLATVSDGIWTRGAIAMAEPIANVDVAFDPATDKAVGKLTRQNVTGLDLAVDAQDGLHAAWGASNGLYYASGTGDPTSTTPWTLEKVSSQTPTGLSLALDDQGNPWISYYGQGKRGAAVLLTHREGTTWTTQEVARASACDACTTAIAFASGGPVLAYSEGRGVSVVTILTKGSLGLVGTQIDQQGGGEGISMASAGNDGVALSYYAGTEVKAAAGGPDSLQPTQVASVADGSATADGARTSIAVDKDGNLTLGWYDAGTDGVAFATAKAGQPAAPIDIGDAAGGGTYPSVGVTGDGSTSYLAWYQTATGPAVSGVVPGDDLLLGMYGSVQGLGLAVQSPTPSAVAAASPTMGPTGAGGATGVPANCEKADASNRVSVVAKGIAFTPETDCIEVQADQPFTIDFDNQDPQTPHNIAIFQSSTDLGNALFTGPIVTGPTKTTYDTSSDLPNGLKPGQYFFHCDVHPTTMTGTVVVK